MTNEMVITSVRAYLQLETDYEIHGFTQPEQAIKHMEGNQVDIAVSIT
jgi:DNA-binding NarL/FixJ family response regulator